LAKVFTLLEFDTLKRWREDMEAAQTEKDKKTVFLSEVNKMNEKIAKEKQESIKAVTNQNGVNGREKDEAIEAQSTKHWIHDDIQLLIKAVNLFPAGTQNRWEVVASYVNQHSTDPRKIQRKGRDVMTKAKDLQKLDPKQKEEANKHAITSVAANSTISVAASESAPSERYDAPAELIGINPAPWTNDEQKLLEQALKTYPASTVDRWDRIAECIPDRSKKDCMLRYKELVEMIKAKKAAQEAAAKKK